MLSIEIAGRWEPQDFIEVLQAIESYYYKLSEDRWHRYKFPFWPYEEFWFERDRVASYSFEALLDRLNRMIVERARYGTPSYGRLSVSAIRYSSPGSVDFLGLARAVEVIANSIGNIVTYFRDADLRRERDQQARLDTDIKRVELEKEHENLQALKIKNAQDALKLFDSHPELQDLFVPLLVRDQDALASRIAEGKLLSARVIPSEQGKG